MNKLDNLIKELCPNGVEYKKIGEIIEKASKSPSGVGKISLFETGNIIAFTSGNKLFYVNDYLVDGEYIFMNDGGQADTKYYAGKAYYSDHVFAFTSKKMKVKFLYHYLLQINDLINKEYFRGGGIKNLVKKDFLNIEIPIPPLPVQEEIVRILDNFTELTKELTAELTARKKQYEHYRDRLLAFNNNVEFVELWKMTSWDKRYNSVEKHKQPRVIKYPTIIAKDLYSLQRDNGNVFLLATGTETGWTNEETAGDLISEGEVIAIPWGKSSPLDKVLKYYSGKFVNGDNRLATSNDKTKLSNKFLFYYIQSKSKEFDTFYRGSSLQHPDMNKVLNYKIPILPLDEQERIVSILDKFDAYCNDLTQGLPAEIEMRQKQYEYYRDKLLNFKRIN